MKRRYQKPTESQRERARALSQEGWTLKAIASKLGMAQSTVYYIVHPEKTRKQQRRRAKLTTKLSAAKKALALANGNGESVGAYPAIIDQKAASLIGKLAARLKRSHVERFELDVETGRFKAVYQRSEEGEL